MSGHRRSPSYDQVVEALLAVAPGLATDKFDAELAAAEAQATARTLREVIDSLRRRDATPPPG